MDVEFGGVDDDIGFGLHRLQNATLFLDRLGLRTVFSCKRMASARAFVAAHEFVSCRFKEHDAKSVALPTQRVERWQCFGVIGTGADNKHDIGDGGIGSIGKVGNAANKRWRKIVDDVPAEIFENVRGLRASGP